LSNNLIELEGKQMLQGLTITEMRPKLPEMLIYVQEMCISYKGVEYWLALKSILNNGDPQDNEGSPEAWSYEIEFFNNMHQPSVPSDGSKFYDEILAEAILAQLKLKESK
jgi:hypothetical protein